MDLKVTGPLIESGVESRIDNVVDQEAFRNITANLRDGDLYVHIHLGWKSVVAFGLTVIPSISALVFQVSHSI